MKVGVYMVDLGEWEEMNAAYLEVFGERTPARFAVGVSWLLSARAPSSTASRTGARVRQRRRQSAPLPGSARTSPSGPISKPPKSRT